MKNFFTYSKTVYLILLSFFLAFAAKAINPREESSISISNYEIHHQGINLLNITLTWKTQNPEGLNIPEAFYKKSDSFLKAYPNTTDWWEIVNKGLTNMLMKEYPDIDSLASDIEVTWVSGAGIDYGHRYPTRSVTCRTKTGKLYEYFGFRTLKDYKICISTNQCYSAYLDVLYRYVKPIADKDYPDGLATENSFKTFLSQFALIESLEKANKESAEEMLKKFPEIAGINAHIELKKNEFNQGTGIDLER